MLHSKKWKINQNKPIDLNLDINPVVKQLLVNRGYNASNVSKFLNPKLSDLHDPFLMKDMDKVVRRVREAIEKGESIWIYGDYDVDGITSIALLLKLFKHLNVPVNYYIPNRLEEGYGLSIQGLTYVIEQGADLIISVDCGITSVEEVDFVNRHGKDIVITDHHNCQESLPSAFGILNPKQPDCHYPFDMLAGVGIALKLAQGMLGEAFFEVYDLFVDIAALGTVADIAPIVDENRIITKIGLELIQNTKHIGLKTLVALSNINGDLNTGHIGFNIGPKINAAGRIGQPGLGVELLITESESEGESLALKLTQLNEERQSIERSILEEIDELVAAQVDLKKDKIIVILGDNWHTGVIGIVASRVTERYHRPAVILSNDEGIAKGSARSVGEISIFDALNSCKELFIGFGGHKQAAGLSLSVEKVEEFRRQVNLYAKTEITWEDLIPQIKVDGVLHSSDITYQTLDDLDLLEPYGLGNPRPQFIYNGLTIDHVRRLGEAQNHLKLILHDERRTYDAIAFNVSEDYADLRTQDKLDMVLTLSKNSFRGVDTIQFQIKDLRRLSSTYYIQKEIGKHFTKTLARALFYNGLGVPKGPRSGFTAYETDQLERLDYVIEKKGKKLILVNGFENFLEIYFRLDDIGYGKDYYGIHFNKIFQYHDLDVVVHPVLDNMDYQRYHEVIVYDLLYNQKWADTLEKLCHVPIKYMAQVFIDEKSQTEVLYTAIPHRMDLVDIYKSLLSEDGNLTITLEDFSKHLHMDLIKCELSLRILDHLKLIEIDGDETYHIKVLPKPNHKLALDDTEVFREVSSIRDQFFNYIKFYKDMIK
ncbi:MAG: single-stranded-DNA-specific exonuclease RecJ [Clostridia bacterium]|nr:single-stranded-DNA-specific exonuclease RecJ [Clostridia bacterium]